MVLLSVGLIYFFPLSDISSLHSILLAFLAYLGLGAYYNYSTYGASGMDLIPYVFFSAPYIAQESTQTSRLLERGSVHA